MERTLARFAHALRRADVPVSPAETLDALAVVQRIGIADPVLLHDALALVLAKSPTEKARFSTCFAQFFHARAFADPVRPVLLRELDVPTLLVQLAQRVEPRIAELASTLLAEDRTTLAWSLQEVALATGLDRMRTLRDKRVLVDELLHALGDDALAALSGGDLLREHPVSVTGLSEQEANALAALVRHLRHYLREQVQAFVDRQYGLRVDATGRQALVDAALAANLDQLPPGYHADARRVVRKLADSLRQRHRRQHLLADRGTLDFRRLLRDNVAHDGLYMRLRWQQRRQRNARIFVVCDLSGSVSRIARFLLTLLYDLAEALPEVRVFGFSSRLGEITAAFRQYGPEQAVEQAILDWGRGSTDYGRALLDLRDAIGGDLDHRSTLIFLGDARGNDYAGRVDVMRQLSRQARQVFWLNPEARERWGEGDSLMRQYAPFCLRIDSCARLTDIERFVDRLLTVTRRH